MIPAHEFLLPQKGYTMSIFSKILDKLGLGKKDGSATGTASGGVKPAAVPPKPAATSAPAKPAPSVIAAKPSGPAATPGSAGRPQGSPDERDELHHASVPATAVAQAPAAISEVDVVKKLEGLAAAQPLKLNWKTSIADLLFLLGIENSYEARKELAIELGCPPELMKDSAKMNT